MRFFSIHLFRLPYICALFRDFSAQMRCIFPNFNVVLFIKTSHVRVNAICEEWMGISIELELFKGPVPLEILLANRKSEHVIGFPPFNRNHHHKRPASQEFNDFQMLNSHLTFNCHIIGSGHSISGHAFIYSFFHRWIDRPAFVRSSIWPIRQDE